MILREEQKLLESVTKVIKFCLIYCCCLKFSLLLFILNVQFRVEGSDLELR